MFDGQDNEFYINMLTFSDSITFISNPTIDIELSYQKCVDDEIDRNTICSFNQTVRTILRFPSIRNKK